MAQSDCISKLKKFSGDLAQHCTISDTIDLSLSHRDPKVLTESLNKQLDKMCAPACYDTITVDIREALDVCQKEENGIKQLPISLPQLEFMCTKDKDLFCPVSTIQHSEELKKISGKSSLDDKDKELLCSSCAPSMYNFFLHSYNSTQSLRLGSSIINTKRLLKTLGTCDNVGKSTSSSYNLLLENPLIWVLSAVFFSSLSISL